MFRIEINGRRYRCPSEWTELSLEKAAVLQELAREQPRAVGDYLLAVTDTGVDTKTPLLSESDRRALNGLLGEWVALLSGAPRQAFETVTDAEVASFIPPLSPFLRSFFGESQFNPRGIASFWQGGVEYLLPASGTDAADTVMPLAWVTARELCEASDILITERLSYAPLLVAVLCRPPGEPYDEETAKGRARRFGELPASVFWELWALVSEAHRYLAGEYPACYDRGDGDGKEPEETSSWEDRMLFVADDRPSELPIVEGMRGYDFMRLLNGKIKRQRAQWSLRWPF